MSLGARFSRALNEAANAAIKDVSIHLLQQYRVSCENLYMYLYRVYTLSVQLVIPMRTHVKYLQQVQIGTMQLVRECYVHCVAQSMTYSETLSTTMQYHCGSF